MILGRLLVVALLLAGTHGDILAQEKRNGPLTAMLMAPANSHTVTIKHRDFTLATLELPVGSWLGISSKKPAIYANYTPTAITDVVAEGDLQLSLGRPSGAHDIVVMDLQDVSVRVVPHYPNGK